MLGAGFLFLPVADHRHRGSGCALIHADRSSDCGKMDEAAFPFQLSSRPHQLIQREVFGAAQDFASDPERRLKAGPVSPPARMGADAAWQVARPRNVMHPGPWLEAAGTRSWARFAVRATGSLVECRDDRFERCLDPQPKPSPQHHPRRSAARTLPPGRPVAGIPSWRSTSLIASRVLAPTLPSGSPTS